MRKVLFFMMGIVLLCTELYAQNRTITGKVTDDKGSPVPNASILVKGTTTGTTSGGASTAATATTVIVKSANGIGCSSIVISCRPRDGCYPHRVISC